jgi:hypothetical protein
MQTDKWFNKKKEECSADIAELLLKHKLLRNERLIVIAPSGVFYLMCMKPLQVS